MKICELTQYGIFDTDLAYPDKKRSNDRLVDCFEIEYYIAATGKSIVNGRSYEIAPDTVLCGKPGQFRRSVFGFRCYFLHITFPTDSPYREQLEQTPDFFQIIDKKAYRKIFESLTAHLVSEGYDPESDFVNARLLELFYYLKKDSQNNLNCPEQFDKNRYRFLPRVLEHIHKNYQRTLTLKELADLAGYSPNYFHHVFRTVMGKTPQEYLTDERLRQARWLLAQGEKPLSEIAYECGFSSQSHLCARFKEHMGCSPGEYRQQITENYRF